jgi:hypothetical protein
MSQSGESDLGDSMELHWDDDESQSDDDESQSDDDESQSDDDESQSDDDESQSENLMNDERVELLVKERIQSVKQELARIVAERVREHSADKKRNREAVEEEEEETKMDVVGDDIPLPPTKKFRSGDRPPVRAAAAANTDAPRPRKPGPGKHDHATRFQEDHPYDEDEEEPQFILGPRNVLMANYQGQLVKVWGGTREGLYWDDDTKDLVAAIEQKRGNLRHFDGSYLCVGCNKYFQPEKMEIDHRPPISETLGGLPRVQVEANGYHFTVVLWEDAQAEFNRRRDRRKLRFLCKPCNASLGGQKGIDASPPKLGDICKKDDSCKH